MKYKIHISDDEVSVLGEPIVLGPTLFFHRDGNVKNADFTAFVFGEMNPEKFSSIAPKMVSLIYEGEV